MNQAQKIEYALRQLLINQRKAIEKDAPSVYEKNVFEGGAIVTGSGRMTIGKWTIQMTGKSAKAKFEKRYGRQDQFESENIEVDFKMSEDSVVIEKWVAYQGRGKYD